MAEAGFQVVFAVESLAAGVPFGVSSVHPGSAEELPALPYLFRRPPVFPGFVAAAGAVA